MSDGKFGPVIQDVNFPPLNVPDEHCIEKGTRFGDPGSASFTGVAHKRWEKLHAVDRDRVMKLILGGKPVIDAEIARGSDDLCLWGERPQEDSVRSVEFRLRHPVMENGIPIRALKLKSVYITPGEEVREYIRAKVNAPVNRLYFKEGRPVVVPLRNPPLGTNTFDFAEREFVVFNQLLQSEVPALPPFYLGQYDQEFRGQKIGFTFLGLPQLRSPRLSEAYYARIYECFFEGEVKAQLEQVLLRDLSELFFAYGRFLRNLHEKGRVIHHYPHLGNISLIEQEDLGSMIWHDGEYATPFGDIHRQDLLGYVVNDLYMGLAEAGLRMITRTGYRLVGARKVTLDESNSHRKKVLNNLREKGVALDRAFLEGYFSDELRSSQENVREEIDRYLSEFAASGYNYHEGYIDSELLNPASTAEIGERNNPLARLAKISLSHAKLF